MPTEEVKLPHQHGKTEEEGLDHEPDGVEPSHLGCNSKAAACVSEEYVLYQPPESQDAKSQLPIEDEHDHSTPIHQTH